MCSQQGQPSKKQKTLYEWLASAPLSPLNFPCGAINVRVLKNKTFGAKVISGCE